MYTDDTGGSCANSGAEDCGWGGGVVWVQADRIQAPGSTEASRPFGWPRCRLPQRVRKARTQSTGGSTAGSANAVGSSPERLGATERVAASVLQLGGHSDSASLPTALLLSPSMPISKENTESARPAQALEAGKRRCLKWSSGAPTESLQSRWRRWRTRRKCQRRRRRLRLRPPHAMSYLPLNSRRPTRHPP